jgi:hypothetical protein
MNATNVKDRCIERFPFHHNKYNPLDRNYKQVYYRSKHICDIQTKASCVAILRHV